MSHEKVRLGIVGTGNIARSHLNGYKILKDAGYDLSLIHIWPPVGPRASATDLPNAYFTH